MYGEVRKRLAHQQMAQHQVDFAEYREQQSYKSLYLLR